jgi:pSer/pThr/pTyr-binding forkhead associated (FHA) protein
MSARPKFNYFLVHLETGQRYPVGDEVVIGRNSGDILFPDDAKVSTQHCRVLKTPQGLAVHDLDSSNGTNLDGTKLDPKKAYVFKPGSVLSFGAQELKLLETSPAKLMSRPRRKSKSRRRRKKKGGLLDIQTFLALVLIAGAGSIMLKPYFHQLSLAHFQFPKKTEVPEIKIEVMPTPLELVEREMRAAFAEYKEIGNQQMLGKIGDRELSAALRTKLIPQLSATRSKIEANKKLLTAVIGQVTAMMGYADTKQAKFQHQLEKFSEQVEVINEEVQKLDDLRRPANL